MNFILTVTDGSKSLEIDSFYNGVVGLNQLLVIDKVTLYFDGSKVVYQLSNPVQISGVNKIVVPIYDQLKEEWSVCYGFIWFKLLMVKIMNDRV